jgi:hypothetical protein
MMAVFLPLIPLFAGLSAIGALAGEAAWFAKAVNDVQMTRNRFEEMVRQNHTMKNIGLCRGSGIYLKQYHKGFGLYIGSGEKTKYSRLASQSTLVQFR